MKTIEQQRAVTLTEEEWTDLTTYILITTKHRVSEAEAWEKLAAEKCPDGSPRFPNQQESLSEYMAELARFKDGKLLKTENHSFKIEADRSDERIQSLTAALQDADETIGRMYGAGGAYCDGLIEGYQERTKARAATWSNG